MIKIQLLYNNLAYSNFQFYALQGLIDLWEIY